MSLFITFEGGEGSGKSTQAELLYHRFLRLNIPAVITHEPGGTAFGEKISDLVRYDGITSPEAELLLFNASRAQLIKDFIRPNLDEGKMVICDRYTGSTFAYQGYGRGISFETIKCINDVATEGLRPDLIILMDVDPAIGLRRKNPHARLQMSLWQIHRFEQQELTFHQRVRQGYLEMAQAEPRLWLMIDACGNIEDVERTIWQKVSTLLDTKKGST